LRLGSPVIRTSGFYLVIAAADTAKQLRRHCHVPSRLPIVGILWKMQARHSWARSGPRCSCRSPGALFSVGDAHAAQGQGEVDQTAIETGLRGKFQLIVRKDMKITWPRGETPTHWIVMGLNPNLEEAMKMAVRETILFITQRFPKLSREEAYMIESVAVDYHVTQVVDGTKGIHGMIPKAIFTSQ
jgi:Acetamidase/Formamidase family